MTVGIILLGAGGSSRMKQNKQLLTFRGKSLLRHAAEEALAATGCADVAEGTSSGDSTRTLGEFCYRNVVVVLGAAADRLQRELQDLPVRCVVNPDWQKGIGTSIRAGVREFVGAEDVMAVLIMLSDQPLVDSHVLRALMKAHEVTHKPIVASQYADTVGVPALFARRYFPQLLSLGDAEGAKRIISQAGKPDVHLMAVSVAEIDVDTPESYTRLIQQEQEARSQNAK